MLKDPQSVFRLAFAIVMLKFMLGGMTVFGLAIPSMSGGEFAAALAAVGGIHTFSKHIDNLAVKDDK